MDPNLTALELRYRLLMELPNAPLEFITRFCFIGKRYINQLHLGCASLVGSICEHRENVDLYILYFIVVFFGRPMKLTYKISLGCCHYRFCSDQNKFLCCVKNHVICIKYIGPLTNLSIVQCVHRFVFRDAWLLLYIIVSCTLIIILLSKVSQYSMVR